MKIENVKTIAKALGFKCLENELMKCHTTFNIGGPADLFIEVSDVNKLPEILKAIKEEQLPLTIIGKGSNLLVSDKGIEGVVLCICDETIKIEGETVNCAAGLRLSRLCLDAKNSSLSGLEFACGIPGTVGGAVFMNAGAYGGEINDVLVSCTSVDLDGNVKVRRNEELKLGYRTSIYKENKEIIISAEFKLQSGDSEQIRAKMEELLSRRKQKQPLEFPSAGSTFKRPLGYFAGVLIEECGLKGCAIGGAEVSVKHAGFVINKGGATCEDIENLIDLIKSTVLKQKGIELETEVIRLGRK